MDKIIRRLKKDYLLAKRDRKANYETRKTNLCSIIKEDDFNIIEVEVSQPFLQQYTDNCLTELLNLKHTQTLDSSILIYKAVQDLDHLFSDTQHIIIYPLDWALWGSIVIDRAIFFKNFDKLFYYLEDGIYIFSPLTEQKVKLRGERYGSDDELKLLVINKD